MNQFLVFSLGDSEFSVPLLRVKSVVLLPRVAPVPYMPSHFKGIINVRGEIISVVDPKKKLNILTEIARPEHSVIIFEHGAQSRGIAVDSVNRVLTVIEGVETPTPPALDIEATLDIGAQ